MRTKLDPNLDSVKGNPGKLQQVFLNLFLNARDAMEPRGVLAGYDSYRRGKQMNGVVVEVIDTGTASRPNI